MDILPFQSLERSPAPTKAKQLPALDRSTEIPGFPLAPSWPGPEITAYGSRGVEMDVSHRIKRRASGTAIIDPIRPAELRKREMSEGRRAISEPGVSVSRLRRRREAGWPASDISGKVQCREGTYWTPSSLCSR